jgi:tetratricopeptide (TPR) repeat protein
VAAQVRRSPLRFALVAALDHWAMLVPAAPEMPRLVEVARRADPDPWRDQVRDVQAWNDLPRLLRLAQDARRQQQTPQIILLLAWRIQKLSSQGEPATLLQKLSGQGEPATLLRHALVHNPQDFWLHFHLGCFFEKDSAARIGCYRAALSVRPDSAPTHFTLGQELHVNKDLDGAFAHFQKAIGLDPKFARAHNDLGLVLQAKKDPDGAIQHFRQAIALDPNSARAHLNLGAALHGKKDPDGAIQHFRQAIALDPNSATGYYNLGLALQLNKDLDGAIQHYRQAVKLDPHNAPAHLSLGSVLKATGDLNGAILHYRQALALNPHFALAHNNLGNALVARKDLDGAILHYRKAIQFDPNLPDAHNNLGNALAVRKDLDGAIRHYHQAIALDPNYAQAYLNLGDGLRLQGKFAAALTALQKAHDLGSKQAGWPSVSARRIKQCERLLELDQKLPSILKGTAQPRDAAEQVELAGICLVKKNPVAAAHFFAAALKAQPQLAGEHRYNAACAAVLAATGRGQDADRLKDGEPARLRQQALDWLKSELADLKQQLQANPNKSGMVKAKWQHWQMDTDLAGVRDPKELARLPEAEHREWQVFWGEVAALLKPANAGSPQE